MGLGAAEGTCYHRPNPLNSYSCLYHIRLGPDQHTRYSPTPISQFTYRIVSVALGQDHTLAVTKSGEVFSWGLNRFSQLGYIIELPSTSGAGLYFGRSEEPIQASPRKVLGPLKKEIVKGVAACKTASACWTEREVFTWGTNHGQLGKRMHSVTSSHNTNEHIVQDMRRLFSQCRFSLVGSRRLRNLF